MPVSYSMPKVPYTRRWNSWNLLQHGRHFVCFRVRSRFEAEPIERKRLHTVCERTQIIRWDGYLWFNLTLGLKYHWWDNISQPAARFQRWLAKLISWHTPQLDRSNLYHYKMFETVHLTLVVSSLLQAAALCTAAVLRAIGWHLEFVRTKSNMLSNEF